VKLIWEIRAEICAGKNDPKVKVKVELRGDEMIMVGTESNRFIYHYHRVVPDLKPGKFQPGEVSHGAPEL
jgi:hypothetical protein